MERTDYEKSLIVRMPAGGGVIRTAEDAFAWIPSGVRNGATESFGAIYLDSGQRVIRRKVLFKGGVSRTLVDTKVVFWEACRLKASAVIVFHNHPSGNVEPSAEDFDTTKRLVNGGKLIGVQVLDHLVVSSWRWLSFRERGLMDKAEGGEEMVADQN